MLSSPTGVFSWTRATDVVEDINNTITTTAIEEADEEEGDSDRNVIVGITKGNGGALRFSAATRRGLCEPRHRLHRLGLDEAVRWMRERQQQQHNHDHLYVRHFFSDATVHRVRARLGLWDLLRSLCLYVSSTGAVTNFHYDTRPGLIVQLRGRKRVTALAPSPEASELMRHPDHAVPGSACERRSRFTEEVQGSAVSDVKFTTVLLAPGDALLVPAGWWHQVKSLDPVTVSVVARLEERESP
jgi:hypothetical protein